MASGHFPIDTTYEEYHLLRDAANNIALALRSLTYDDNQYDNAASDGGYLAELYLAKKLIEGAIIE